jgi:hypothetical protein
MEGFFYSFPILVRFFVRPVEVDDQE